MTKDTPTSQCPVDFVMLTGPAVDRINGVDHSYLQKAEQRIVLFTHTQGEQTALKQYLRDQLKLDPLNQMEPATLQLRSISSHKRDALAQLHDVRALIYHVKNRNRLEAATGVKAIDPDEINLPAVTDQIWKVLQLELATDEGKAGIPSGETAELTEIKKQPRTPLREDPKVIDATSQLGNVLARKRGGDKSPGQ